MKIAHIWGVKRKTRFKRIIHGFVLIFGMLSLLMGIVSFYGANTGNFTVSVRGLESKHITLAIQEDFSDSRTILRFQGQNSYRATSYNIVQNRYLPEILQTKGRYSNEYVLAFNFYLRNGSEVATIQRLDYLIFIHEVTKEIDEALRFLVIVDGVSSIYEKTPGRTPGLTTRAFESEVIAVSNSLSNVRSKEVIPFTVVMWLEGDLVNNDMFGGSFKMEMNFIIEDGT